MTLQSTAFALRPMRAYAQHHQPEGRSNASHISLRMWETDIGREPPFGKPLHINLKVRPHASDPHMPGSCFTDCSDRRGSPRRVRLSNRVSIVLFRVHAPGSKANWGVTRRNPLTIHSIGALHCV